MDITNKEIHSSLTKIGLNPSIISTHHKRVMGERSNSGKRYFHIVDTCRLDNHGILPFPTELVADLNPPTGIASLIPAAGAATRYLAPLFEIERLLDDPAPSSQFAATALLKRAITEGWPLPLPKALTQAILNSESPEDWGDQLKKELSVLVKLPKALFPCTVNGPTFLAIKIAEYAALGCFDAQIFIAPLNRGTDVEHILARLMAGLDIPTHVLEQGPVQSTIRFLPDGKPYLEDSSDFSVVPAGHGALTACLNDIRSKLPTCHTVLIRNIDNVNGTHSHSLKSTRGFLSFYGLIRDHMQQIRSDLSANKIKEAEESATILLTEVCGPKRKHHLPPLEAVMLEIFHWETESSKTRIEIDHLKWLYDRPLNILGQVPNSGKDIGGSPVFVDSTHFQTRIKMKLPKKIKLCIEGPHVSPEETSNILANSKLATHFNPVFIAAELPNDPNYYENDDSPFWLITRKRHRNQDVVYHESLISEVLGNSLFCNCIFVEIPRTLFNPHKTLADAAGRKTSDWLPHVPERL